MWDEECNHHLFTAEATRDAEELILLLADYNMVMTLPKWLPTIQSMSTKNWTRVDNIFCTDNIANSIVTCNTAPGRRGPGTDHIPILTSLEVNVEVKDPEPFQNFRMVDCGEFHDQLVKQLESVPEVRELKTIGEYNEMISALTATIQNTIEIVVTLSKPILHSCRWWSRELTELKKAKNRLNHISYIHRTVADHPAHKEHKEITERYSRAMSKAKAQHWADYLEDLNDGLLWSANKYLANPVTDGGRSQIPMLHTTRPNGTTCMAETNEDKSETLATAFFPPKPAASQILLN